MIINQPANPDMKKSQVFASELEALSIVLGALEPLDDEKRHFVLKTVSDRLNIFNVQPAKAPQDEAVAPPHKLLFKVGRPSRTYLQRIF
jgi:hypothetical protein